MKTSRPPLTFTGKLLYAPGVPVGNAEGGCVWATGDSHEDTRGCEAECETRREVVVCEESEGSHVIGGRECEGCREEEKGRGEEKGLHAKLIKLSLMSIKFT